MALVDWTVTPLSFTVTENRADVIVAFHNSITLADFKEHAFCFDLAGLKAAALSRIAVLDQTDPTADLKPVLNTPLDFTVKPPDPPTPLQDFVASVRQLQRKKILVDLTVKKTADADYQTLVASIQADLLAHPEWEDAV